MQRKGFDDLSLINLARGLTSHSEIYFARVDDRNAIWSPISESILFMEGLLGSLRDVGIDEYADYNVSSALCSTIFILHHFMRKYVILSFRLSCIENFVLTNNNTVIGIRNASRMNFVRSRSPGAHFVRSFFQCPNIPICVKN